LVVVPVSITMVQPTLLSACCLVHVVHVNHLAAAAAAAAVVVTPVQAISWPF
jgi:hypothetical protein